ncbi:hypothetical protein HMN09_00135300 [Mycena chlorophos]|uniref:DUF3752 domain-containing protein n=1 Tax=Mycena chlorophos TaxID=658473 RepID=A0A8H6TPP6_MYCCL|nr:hypothetical protein HMN09_00135300 [Mycena chlorophos]
MLPDMSGTKALPYPRCHRRRRAGAQTQKREAEAGTGAAGDDDEDAYAPSLPPDLLVAHAGLFYPQHSTTVASSPKQVAGPVKGQSLPPVYVAPARQGYDDDDLDDDVGPRLLCASTTEVGREEAAQPKAATRDGWMLVPPPSSALFGTLGPAKLSKGRQFSRGTVVERQGTQGASTLWTEARTPVERQQRLANDLAGKKRRLVNLTPVPASPEP